jgi:class 3 adenylate cyclase/tetratricopeptide (TPR) repeat protein
LTRQRFRCRRASQKRNRSAKLASLTAGDLDRSEPDQFCPMCGEANPPQFRFCGYCGTPFPGAQPVSEVRKTVTILFCDLKGSTALGESIDSEALREVMSAYFGEMRAAIEGHGGTIEKLIGDAVMAVFGIPRVHEDDALRAVRAADEMKRRLGELNAELQARWDVRLENRTGVNTGEVVSGTAVAGQRLVVGDALNVAARLEEAAPTNQILIGERTYRLVRDCVEVEELEPLELKGKAESVPAFRLTAVTEGEALSRHHWRPMVGREEELGLLRSSFAAAARGRGGMATVVGDAGIGKSRLTEEFVRSVDGEAQILRGRCLPYGRGITFWPLSEMIRASASIAPEDHPEVGLAKLSELAADGGVAERVGSVIGLTTAQFSVDEILWGTRKLLERLAGERPVVVVFDDIQWAEPTLLDLVRHVADSAEGPVFVLCMARPDLLERQPEWPQTSDSPLISLGPLSPDAMGRIVENTLGSGEVADEIRARILEAADGNPLFVEQMLSMLIDDGTLVLEDGRWRPTSQLSDAAVPPTIQALLTARIEQLEREDRAVVDPASVAGLRFARAAVEFLIDEPLTRAVDSRLAALGGKQLVRRDPNGPFAEDGYRFEHVLIREAAYRRVLKRRRASLHERFVDWSDQMNRERGREAEFDEILGYHLEQAHAYLSELGPLDDHGRELGRRAATRLSNAGGRAFNRGDMPAAAKLLRRAADLMPAGGRPRLDLLPDLGEALVDTGEFHAAEAFLTEAIDGAQAIGDERLKARAQAVRWLLKGHADAADPATWADDAVRWGESVLPALERAGDDAGLAAAYRLLAWAHGTVCRFGEVAAAAEQAVRYAERAGDERQRRHAASQYAIAACWGPLPVPEAVARCEDILDRSHGDRRTVGLVTNLLGRLEAMRGNFDRARRLAREARATLEDMGKSVVTASTSLESSGIELLAGDAAAAERLLRRDYEALEEMGERYLLLPTVAAELAHALAEIGQYDEAARYTRLAEELVAEDDREAQALWRRVRARVMARNGEFDGALELAHEAADLLRDTDALVARADALVALSEVAAAAGRHREARAFGEEALGLYERKGDVVSADNARGVIGRPARPAGQGAPEPVLGPAVARPSPEP